MTFKELVGQHGMATKLGRSLGVSHMTVLLWARGRIPAERVMAVEQATGLPRHELRPDLYPPAREAVAAASIEAQRGGA